MTDYEKMKHLYNKLSIGYSEEVDYFKNKTIFVHNTNVTFVFNENTEEYITMNIDY